MSNQHFRQDVQGLRGIAVLAVILYHGRGFLPGGFTGVDVFFVISGYVITRSLLVEHTQFRTISLRSFYQRRVLRLTPALAVMLALVLVLNTLLGPLGIQQKSFQTGLASNFLLANLFLIEGDGYFTQVSELNPFLHTWSLSLEEQFYLTFPLVLFGLLRLGRKAAMTGLIFGSSASLLLMFFLLSSALPIPDLLSDRMAFFLMPARAWQFGAGAIVATAPNFVRTPEFLREAFGILGAFLILAGFILLPNTTNYPSIWALVPTIGAVCILLSEKSVVGNLLQNPTLIRIGDLSYSYYLWHWPIMVWAFASGVEQRWLLALIGLGTYPIAAVSHRFVEQRFKHTPTSQSIKPPPAMLIGLVSLFCVLVAAGAAIGIQRVLEKDALLASALASREYNLDRSCGGTMDRAAAKCEVHVGREGNVVLVGDSNAAQFADVIGDLARQRDWTYTVMTHYGCPTVLGLDAFVKRSCALHNRQALEHASKSAADVVVLSSRAEQLAGDHPGEYAAAFEALVDAFRTAGSQVIVIQPIPKFGAVEIKAIRCSTIRVLIEPKGCSERIPRASADHFREAQLDNQRRVLADSGVTEIDPFEFVCLRSPCSDLIDGEFRYRDSGHLNLRGADLGKAALDFAISDALERSRAS